MKKIKKAIVAIIAALAVSTGALAGGGLGTYDMADYGTSLTITNSGAATAISRIFITYDSASTNTITIDRSYNSITYRVDTEAGTNVTYDLWDPTDALQWRPNEVLVIGTTDTNVNLMLEFEDPS